MKQPHIPIPDSMQNLEKTDRGYLKPWFVKGDDFRVTDGEKAWLSVSKKACWICGQPFKPQEYALVCSPTLAMSRLCEEPPCHMDCARYAVQVCPFILYPNAKRRTANLPEESTLEHHNKDRNLKLDGANPGAYYIVLVNDFSWVEKHKIMAYKESNVLMRELWIEGEQIIPHPEPIVPLENLPPALREVAVKTNDLV
jgi:hypothetical protein